MIALTLGDIAVGTVLLVAYFAGALSLALVLFLYALVKR